MSASKANQQTEPNRDVEALGDGAPISGDRRAAIARMGKYASYTAPAMLTLLLPVSSRAAIGSPPPPPTGAMFDFQAPESPPADRFE